MRKVLSGILSGIWIALWAAYPVWADGVLLAVRGQDAVYLYWGTAGSGDYVLYRAQGEGAYGQIARITPVTDPAQANKILLSAPDVLSQALTVGEDFARKAAERPDLDRAVSLASVGYALARGHAYLDRDLLSAARYRYRLTAPNADGTERIIGETEVYTGDPFIPAAPVIHADLLNDRPRVRITAAPLVRYHVERGDKSDGSFERVTVTPLVAARDGGPLDHRDTTVALDGRTYFYRVVPYNVFDQAGTLSGTLEIITPDRTPPEPPHVDIPNNEPASAMLTWQAGREPDLAGYHVYRREVLKGKGNDEKPLLGPEKRLTTALLAPDVTKYGDRNVVPGQIYQYEITATDRAGNESVHSPPVLARPRDTQPPAKPQGLGAKAQENGRVVLTWTPNKDADLYAYRLYRGGDGGDPQFVTHLRVKDLKPGKVVTYEDRLDPKSQATYRYAISAVDGTENESPISETVSVRLPDHAGPGAPIVTGLEAGDGLLTVRWDPAPDPDVAGYQLYRSTKGDKPERLTARPLPADARVFQDRSVQAGVVYGYSVSAIDRSGNEGAMSEVRSGATFAVTEAVAPVGLTIDRKARPWRITWQAPASAKGFVVYIARTRDGDYRPFGPMIQSPYVEVPVPDRDTDWYRVQAVYTNGNVSALSEPVAVENPEQRNQ
jgi:fibronectin type 3 domain-containing protein